MPSLPAIEQSVPLAHTSSAVSSLMLDQKRDAASVISFMPSAMVRDGITRIEFH